MQGLRIPDFLHEESVETVDRDHAVGRVVTLVVDYIRPMFLECKATNNRDPQN